MLSIIKYLYNNNYCRISNTETELGVIAQLVRRFFFDRDQFTPSDLVVITWDRVTNFDGGTDQV